jgi:hypothetical protein
MAKVLSSYLQAKARYIEAEKKIAELERKIDIIQSAHKADKGGKMLNIARVQQLILLWQDESKIHPAAGLNAKQIARFISQLRGLIDEPDSGAAR